MVPFIDLETQYRRLKEDIDRNIQTVLDHGQFIMGPEVLKLEEQLAHYVGVKHCISCSSGTDALLMPLMAWGIGPGDAVFTTPFTFMSTGEVINLLGATPIFADIDPNTFNLDPQRLEQAITSVINSSQLTPKAIIPVDLFGLPADYTALEEIAEKYHLKLLADSAQGLGGTCYGRQAGSFGDAGTTSFFPAKPLGCYGDGGAVFTQDDELAQIIQSIRVHGKGKDKYDNVRMGLNARLDTIQAAILLVKLKAFIDYELEARQRFAEMYSRELQQYFRVQSIPDGFTSSWAMYSLLAKDNQERAKVMERLKESGIPTMIYYRKPLHLQTVYGDLGYQPGDFPVSEEVSSRIFSLPMHPYLTMDLVDRIVMLIKKSLE